MTSRTARSISALKAVSIRLVIQVLVAVIGWVVFIYLWYVTLAYRVIGLRPYLELAAIALTALVVIVITQYWVWHNVRIWRRKGPRKNVTIAEFDFSRDWLGRSVNADWQSLKGDSLINIIIEDGAKIYRPERPQA